MTVYPCDQPRPEASNLNFGAGDEVANHVTAKVSATGTVCIYTSASTDLVIDVEGGYIPQNPV